MSKAKELETALNGLIGKNETEQFLGKILNLAKSDPVKAKKKIKMAKAFL